MRKKNVPRGYVANTITSEFIALREQMPLARAVGHEFFEDRNIPRTDCRNNVALVSHGSDRTPGAGATCDPGSSGQTVPNVVLPSVSVAKLLVEASFEFVASLLERSSAPDVPRV